MRGATLALISIHAVGACSQDSQPQVRGVAYYRSHAAEWERRVWDCTNEPPGFEHASDCVNALLALKSKADEAKAPSDLPGSTD